MTTAELEKEINHANTLAYYDATDDFTAKTGAELLRKCHRLASEVALRYASVNNGFAPAPFGAFDRDEIARIFNTDATVVYNMYTVNAEVDPAKVELRDWTDCTCYGEVEAESIEAGDRFLFCKAYKKYLYTAAALAKSVGALQTMNMYMTGWGIMEREMTIARSQYGFTISAEDALRIVNLERVASERLWGEVEVCRLPEILPWYEQSRRRAARKSAKTTAKKRKA